MLSDAVGPIVEAALGRRLEPDEEGGYSSLAALPPKVFDAAKTIFAAQNTVAVIVYLRHVVPSASHNEIVHFVDALRVSWRDEAARDGGRVAGETPRNRRTADADCGLCPSCEGRGWCKWCGGSGAPLSATSKSCDGCAGKGVCVLCDGSGQLVAGHYAFAEWERDQTGPPPRAMSVEDRALSEKMRANKMKYMQDRVQKPARLAPPADRPIFKKWETDDFCGDAMVSATASADPVRVQDHDTTFHLERLASEDPRVRAVSLNALATAPQRDERLLEACESLLGDRAITLLSLPYTYGEVCWLAAEAVAALRGVFGRTDVVVVEDVFAPVSGSVVEQLAREAGVERSAKAGVDGAIETLERIAAAGGLPRRRITREPAAPGS